MKKEIILVNLPPGNNYDYKDAGRVYPATGIMVVGTVLKKRGFSVSLIDGAVDSHYEQSVLGEISDETAFIGFSIMTSQLGMAYRLTKKIKENNPEALVVFGGVHPTLFPEQTVSNPYIDIAVINEGANTALEIMDYIDGKKNLEVIKGIAFCNKNGKAMVTSPRPLDDISEIPHFDFSLLDIQRYLKAHSVYERELNLNGNKNVRLMPILTGLGCCFRCAFCINVILGRRYRIRPAESILEEIKRLQAQYDANAFLFYDEDFCIDKKRLTEFIHLVKKENIDFLGRIWARVSYFKYESFQKILPEMEKIGIKSVAMGAECGSQRMLEYICKDIKLEDIIFATEALSKVNITPRLSFMTGLFGENKKDTIATYKLCVLLLRLNPLVDIAGPFIFRYYPGSPIFQQLVDKYNIKLPQTIEEWENSLNADGSLKVDFQKWTWPGFLKYDEIMRKYIAIYVEILNKPGYRKRFLTTIIKKTILWRVEHGEHFYILDYFLFYSMRKFKRLLSKIFISKEQGQA